MAERPEDLNLPTAVITRIIKDAIPDGVNVSKEARLAISKAASVFVLYATSCSNNFALKGKRKTITAPDVLSALEDMEFDQFVDPLKECLAAYKRGLQGKKDLKKKEKEAANQPKGDEDDDNDVETIDDDDDDSVVAQDETGNPTGAQTVAANGDAESVVEISDSSDD